MFDRKVTLEQVDNIPNKSSWSLPKDKMYVRLGCQGCVNQVCIVADQITAQTPRFSRTPEDTEAFFDIVDEVEKKTTIHQGMSSIYDDQCDVPCPEAIETVVELLNERFEATLQLPTTQE